MKKRSSVQPVPRVVRGKLSPLPAATQSSMSTTVTRFADERCEQGTDRSEGTDEDRIGMAVAASATRSPSKKFQRLQTLALLAQDHVAAMHTGDFVTRSRLRWLQDPAAVESDRARAWRLSRESAALVVQSAWRRSAAVRLRVRLVRGVWQQQLELAAWLTRDRERLRAVLETLRATFKRALSATQRDITHSQPNDGRLATLRGAYYHLPSLLLATWLCFNLGIRRRSRFLRRPAPAIIHAVHIPVLATCRLLTQLWRETTQLAARAIQCRTRTYLARCKYWKLLAAHTKSQAALRLQTVYRAWIARRLAWRLRRRCAAVRVQCCWRCHRARVCVQRMRVAQIAAAFLTGVTIQAVEHVSVLVLQHAAQKIQRTFRGLRARGQFRELIVRHEQLQWHRNPSKGYRLFEKRQYSQAAVHLERCFRQGIFLENGIDSTPIARDSDLRCLAPRGSRLAYSFSDAPAPLESPFTSTDGRPRCDQRRPASASPDTGSATMVSLLSAKLRFWQTYALSHWFSFDSNGDPLHLRQARLGFEAYLRLDSASLRVTSTPTAEHAELQLIRLNARVCLVKCVYLSSGQRDASGVDNADALPLCIEALDELELLSGLTTSDMVREASAWRAQLFMVSAALHLREKEYDECLTQLRSLLRLIQLEPSSTPDQLDVQFLIALVLLHKARGWQEAEHLLKICFQDVELWPGVGFYHGKLTSVDAAARLQGEPVGSFLLYHDVAASAQITLDRGSDTELPKLLLKVKLSDEPCKILSLRIQFEGGLYHMKKLPNCSHFAVHELIQQLPPAAGIQWDKGVRRGVVVSALAAKLPPGTKARNDRRRLLLPWKQWAWRFSATPTRQNESWSALCQHFAVRLEASEAYEMAAFVARNGLVTCRDRALRAELFFTLGRVSALLQRRVDAALALQQARIESARLTTRFDGNYAAVSRAISRIGAHSHSFADQLERAGKLERMAVKAWSFDSCASRLRGSPFCEALLLQRIDDEDADGSVADTFFLRSLARAHVKAFLRRDYFEIKHLQLAFSCVQRLFHRFQRASLSPDETNGLFACSQHILHADEAGLSTASVHFSLSALLVSWHRMPFQVAFEMAEVLYRWSETDRGALIDVLESLYGRLRSAKPRNWAYASYEELLLIRLAFLYAQRSVQGTNLASLAAARRAVVLMDELIALRSMRALGAHIRDVSKRIQWPVASLRFPIQFSLEELYFIRGFLWLRLSKMAKDPSAARASAWRDFDVLHRQLRAVVESEQQRERETKKQREKLKGVRVFVGDSVNLRVADVLHSRPFVSVQGDKTQASTQTPPTWMNQLSPSWNEHVEVDVGSSKARLTVVVMNRSTQLRRQVARDGGDQALGYVQVDVEDLLATGAALQRPRWYNIVCREDGGPSTKTSVAGERPRIRLGFELTMKVTTPDNRAGLAGRSMRRRMCGNWEVDDVTSHLHGDLRQFVETPWVWRWYARKWLDDKEFGIGAWFLHRAIEAAGDAGALPMTASNANANANSLELATDLEQLALCHRATMGSCGAEAVRSLLEKAMTSVQTVYQAGGSSDQSLRRRLGALATSLDPQHTDDQPTATELAKRIPASSHWIAMQPREGGVYYFNEDTWERFEAVASEPSVREPLEWEDGEAVVATSHDMLRARRVVVMNTEMKARVAMLCHQQRELLARGPGQWVAVFNSRKGVMHFLSLTLDTAVVTTMTTEQPTAYAMLVDDFMMYHVLVVQDTFRKYQRRRRRQRRLRGLLLCAYALARERHAAGRRLRERAEVERRRQLNCLHVVVESAAGLRAMDLLTSDPFVLVEVVGGDGDVVAKGQTSVKKNSVNPRWHEEFRFHYAFLDHERSAAAQSDAAPTLRLCVFDRDLVRTHRRDDNEAKRLIDERKLNNDDDDDDDDDKPGENAAETTQRTQHDFLGLAWAPIASFVHGWCVAADLVLRDQHGDESPRSRGTLSVTVQWLHDPEHQLTQQRRNAVKPMLLVKPRKRTRPKPVLQAEWVELFDEARQARATMIARMGDVAVLLDQLVRLFKRWCAAQVSGRTADEAKLMERRLAAAMVAPQPFHTKCSALLESAANASAAVAALVAAIHVPIVDLLESSEKGAAAGLRAAFECASVALHSASHVSSLWDLQSDEGVADFERLARRLLSLRTSADVWRRELMLLVTMFFDPPHPTWSEPTGAETVALQFAKIESLLLETAETVRSFSSATAPVATAAVAAINITSGAPSLSDHKIIPVGATPMISGMADAAPRLVMPTAAVARRLERIEREKRKAKKK